MLSKAIIIGLCSTGIISTTAVTGAATNMMPVSVEVAAGPVRIETGHGKFFSAHLEASSKSALVIELKDDRRLRINF